MFWDGRDYDYTCCMDVWWWGATCSKLGRIWTQVQRPYCSMCCIRWCLREWSFEFYAMKVIGRTPHTKWIPRVCQHWPLSLLVLGCWFRPERLTGLPLKLSSRFGENRSYLPGHSAVWGLRRRVGSKNEESKKRVQPVEISFLSGFFGCEASFLFLSADSVPLGCSLLWKRCGVFLWAQQQQGLLCLCILPLLWSREALLDGDMGRGMS